jgi:YwiC-like protein
MHEPASASPVARERALWRAVSIPSEHGGWGLTLEPVLLGLLVGFSWSGLAVGAAAVLAFLIRTPLKLALVDRRRQRSRPRTRLARRIALGELALLAGLAVVAVVAAGWSWLVPVVVALPLFGVELWFDVRSRSRRLVPELCGGVGMASVAAAIVVAGNGSVALAAAVSLVVAARAVASIPFVRTQIARLHHGSAPTATSDASQVAGVLVAVAAAWVDADVVAGTVAIAMLAAAQLLWVRRPVPPAKVLGLRQMVLGLAVVAITAAGVLASG